MVQEKQLKELFKYIQSNWGVYVTQIDKTDIKRIFGGVLCEDIMNNTLHEVKAEPEELKGNCSTFDMSRLVDQEYKPTDQATDQATDQVTDQVAEPTEQPSSQAILDNSFDRERFERMFCSISSRGYSKFENIIKDTQEYLQQLDAYYASKDASKEGGANE